MKWGALECVGSYQDTFKHVLASSGIQSLRLCKPEPVAPAHPCARDIPFILNISSTSNDVHLSEVTSPNIRKKRRLIKFRITVLLPVRNH